MTAASSFATVFMRFPFASKRGKEDQAIGVPGIEPSENMQQITVSAPNVTFSGTERQKACTATHRVASATGFSIGMESNIAEPDHGK